MSDNAPPPPTLYIEFPLAEVLVCELCERAVVLEAVTRQKSIFKAASRRQNYVKHLKRQHNVPAESVKIRCAACGRVSEKPSRSAWRDTQSHHLREHREPVVEIKVVEPVLAEEEADEVQGNPGTSEKKDEEEAVRPKIVEVTKGVPPKAIGHEKIVCELFSRPSTSKSNDPPPVEKWTVSGYHPNVANILIVQEKNYWQSETIIVSAMGVDALDRKTVADSQAEPICSTPKKSREQAASLSPIGDAAELSRIIYPQARSPINTNFTRALSSPPTPPSKMVIPQARPPVNENFKRSQSSPPTFSYKLIVPKARPPINPAYKRSMSGPSVLSPKKKFHLA